MNVKRLVSKHGRLKAEAVLAARFEDEGYSGNVARGLARDKIRENPCIAEEYRGKVGEGINKAWLPYEGPRGGEGWFNPRTNEVLYQEEPPDGVSRDEELRYASVDIVETEDGAAYVKRGLPWDEGESTARRAVTGASVLESIGVPVPAHTYEDGDLFVEAIPGETLTDLQHAEGARVDADSLLDAYASQILIGNYDLHPDQFVATEDGIVYPVDLDHAGQGPGDWVRGRVVDTVETAKSLGVDITTRDVMERVEELASRVDPEELYAEADEDENWDLEAIGLNAAFARDGELWREAGLEKMKDGKEPEWSTRQREDGYEEEGEAGGRDEPGVNWLEDSSLHRVINEEGVTVGVAFDMPESQVYVDWKRDAFENQLDGPHVSIYESLDDLETATNNATEPLRNSPIEKERVYIGDPSEAPEGAEVIQGERGGLYYESTEDEPPSLEEVLDLAGLGGMAEEKPPKSGEDGYESPWPDLYEGLQEYAGVVRDIVGFHIPGATVDVEWVDVQDGERLHGYIRDEGGDPIGEFDRRFIEHIDSVEFRKGLFELRSEYQGRGVGSELEKETIRLAEDLAGERGVPVNITMEANITVGGYAWAKFGYEPPLDSIVRENLTTEMTERLESIYWDSELVSEEVYVEALETIQDFQDGIGPLSAVTSLGVGEEFESDFMYGSGHLGKHLLMETKYTAELMVSP